MDEPNQNVAFLLNHNEMNTGTLVFTHERMRNQMQEDIRQQTAGLRVIQPELRHVYKWKRTHRKGRHGVECIAMNLGRDKGKNKIRNTRLGFKFAVATR